MNRTYLSPAELEAALVEVATSPGDGGQVALIVVRPALDQRERHAAVRLSPEEGVEGDYWRARGGVVDQQVSLMNARLLRLLAGGDEARMAEAGDNLIVDLDLSDDNLPPGTRLRAGEVLLEMTDAPHTGCGKFAARFGPDAARFINAGERRGLHLRGRYARVIEAGTMHVGDGIWKV